MKKSIKGLVQASFLVLTTMFLVVSCSDKDYSEPPPTPSPAEIQIQEVLKELDKVEGVNEFVQALKNASSSITVDLDEEKLTVFAPKNYSKTRATDETLKRHIAKGATDITIFSGDTLKLETLSGEKLYVIKTEDGSVQVNGISLAQEDRIAAGNSYVYVLENTIPAEEVFFTPKYEIKFKVLECNMDWSSENNAETFPSDDAIIRFYRKIQIGEFEVLDSVKTDTKGYASFKHSYPFDLYYQVENDPAYMKIDGYIPVGIFTTQEEIDAAPMYRTNTSLDNLKPGSLKLLDANGDMLINESDRLTSDYFMVNSDNDEQIVYLVPPSNSYTDENYFNTVENLRTALTGLKNLYTTFVILNYDVDHCLTNNKVDFPKLNNFTQFTDVMWGMGWQYIQTYLRYKDAVEKASNRIVLLEEWNKHLTDSEFAYIYLTLVSYYGDLPLFTEVPKEPTTNYIRNPKAEIVAYIESITKNVSVINQYAIKSLLARYYANDEDKQYQKIVAYTNDIINSGKFALVAKPLETVSNAEVILGGYFDANNKIFHPVRYREVILLRAEAAFELGETNHALEYVNQVQRANNQMEYTTVSRDIIRTMWNKEFPAEGMSYMLLNRWGTLLEVLGQYGAMSYNKLLPIPQAEISYNPALTQNSGY